MTVTARRVLVIGGARSGKSTFAQGLAERTATDRLFIATAQAFDAEMLERIARHRQERAEGWQTIEASIELAAAIGRGARPGRVVLADCLTLWLSNVMLAGSDTVHATSSLCEVLNDAAGPVIMVSNEVGHGIVPETALGRAFRDAQGRLNQDMAAICDAVVWVAAGLPRLIKPAPLLDLQLS